MAGLKSRVDNQQSHINTLLKRKDHEVRGSSLVYCQVGKEEIDINDRSPAPDTISSFSKQHSTAGSNRVMGLKGWRDIFSERGNTMVVTQGWPCWAFVLESRGWTILSLWFDDTK